MLQYMPIVGFGCVTDMSAERNEDGTFVEGAVDLVMVSETCVTYFDRCPETGLTRIHINDGTVKLLNFDYNEAVKEATARRMQPQQITAPPNPELWRGH